MMFAGLILLSLSISSCDFFAINTRQTRVENRMVSEIITQFEGYNMIFNFDNASSQDLDYILARMRNNGSYFMINYDLKDNSSHMLLRPPGYKFLHVVLLENYNKFDRYMNADQFNLEHKDVVLFIINLHLNNTNPNTSPRSFAQPFKLWEPNRLNRTGTVFVLDSSDISLYTICFYCGNLSKVLQRISGLQINGTKVAIPYLPKRTNIFKEFNSHTFTIVFVEYRPYFWREINSTKGKEVFGSEGELLNVISKKLNFKIKLIDFSSLSDAWKEMVNAVKNRKVDWACGGITVSLDRIKVVDFTNFIRPEPYTALYSVYEDIWMSWENILMPFQLELWLLLIGTTCIISLLMHVSLKFTHGGKSFSFLYYMQGLWRYMVEQPIEILPPIFRSRYTTSVLWVVWWSVTIILTNVYKSILTSSLINSNAFEPNSIDGLVGLDFQYQVNSEDASVLIENLQSSNDPVFLNVLKRAKNDVPICASVVRTIGRRVAVIDEETTLNYEVITNCRKLMTITEKDNLRLIRQELFPSTQAWPLQLAAPYRASFSNAISRLHAAGLFLKWHSDSMSGVLIRKSHQGTSAISEIKYDLISILGPSLIWLLGITLSMIAFLIEKCLYKRKMKKLNKKL